MLSLLVPSVALVVSGTRFPLSATSVTCVVVPTTSQLLAQGAATVTQYSASGAVVLSGAISSSSVVTCTLGNVSALTAGVAYAVRVSVNGVDVVQIGSAVLSVMSAVTLVAVAPRVVTPCGRVGRRRKCCRDG